MLIDAAFAALLLLAQQPAPDQERRLVNSQFRQARGAEASSHPIMVGVTIFRLRLPAPADPDQARRLVHEETGERTYTLERVTRTSPLRNREKVIVHVESSRKGFLYVVSQEQYADGSTSAPELVFPTTRIRGGDNSVRAGQVVELPSSSDLPAFWRLVQSRTDHVGELLTILVSPRPLPEVAPSRDSQPVSTALLERWKKTLSVETKVLETGAKPATATSSENAVASGKHLQPDDPAPETIYRAVAQPSAGLLVLHPIRFQVSP